MAGDWIPVRHDLFEDPAVIAMAARLDIDEDAVVGKLLRVWGWFDRQSTNGTAMTTVKWIDRLVSCDGFAAAMKSVGWLDGEDGSISVPRFDSWISQSAKARIQATKRQQDKRLRDGVTPLLRSERDENATTEQNRRGKAVKAFSAPQAGSPALAAATGETGTADRGKSIFRDVEPKHLGDTRALLEWLKWQARNPKDTKGGILEVNESSFELVISAAEHVLADKSIRNPERLWARLVAKKDLSKIKLEARESALKRIADFNAEAQKRGVKTLEGVGK